MYNWLAFAIGAPWRFYCFVVLPMEGISICQTERRQSSSVENIL